MLYSIDTGRATAGQVDVHVRPYVLMGRPPIIYCHSGAGDARECLGTVFSSIKDVTRAVIGQSFTVTASSQFATFGNAVARSRIRDAIAYARTVGATNDPPIMVGVSMGAPCSMNFATHPDEEEVAAIVNFIPAFDLETAREDNIGGNRAVIDAAWGVTYPTPLPPGADPAQNTAALSAVPMQLWYSSDDVWTQTIGPFAAATGAEIHDVGALGHSNAAIAAADLSQVASFIHAHAS